MTAEGAGVETPLLSVKHSVPPHPRNAVQRPRLLRQIADDDRPRLCVVVAAAGWGKTTFLAQWAHQLAETTRVAWISLDGSDNHPTRFWSYLITGVKNATGMGAEALRAVSAPGVDPLQVAVPLLINELASSQQDCVLILDDFHSITDRHIHEGIEFLLSYLPPAVTLVVSSRADPPLPLAQLRARGELIEVRADDLRFTPAESASMLASVGRVTLSDRTATALCHRTEGWAAGLQLAGLVLRGSEEPAVTADGFRGDERHVLDYLSAEVLDKIEEGHRDLLVRTSVLERLSGPLCDEVLQRRGSAEILMELERRNLFVAPMDRHRAWYRCHGLFRDVLRRELERTAPSSVPQLLTSAASWYAGQAEYDQAVRYRIAAADLAGAIELLRVHEDWFFERGASSTYLELGEQVAAGGAADAQVFLMLAYAAALAGQFDRVRSWCQAAEALLADGSAAFDGPITFDGWHSALASVLSMRAAYGHAEDDHTGAFADARRAVDLETDPMLPGYVVSRVTLASAQLRAEHFAEAVELLADVWARPARHLLPTPVVLQAAGLFGLALVHMDEVDQARRVIKSVAARVDAVEATWGEAAAASMTWIRLVEGRIAYRSGDPAAAPLLRRAVALADIWGRSTDLVMALTSLAGAELAAGDRVAARNALSRAREVADSEPIRRVAARELESVETRLGRGAIRAARRAGRLHEELTGRELAILRALVGHQSQREIGEALFLSVNTVKGYTKSLYRKLGAASRADAVERGHDLGLI